MPQRRDFLKGLGGATLALAGDALMPSLARAFAGEYDALAAPPLELLSGKRPLIRRTYRPPNFETPIHYFNEVFTPNDAFFVRYHLTNIPRVDSKLWRLRVEGDAVKNVSEFNLETLRRDFERVEIAAVNQCAGNRRGLFEPRAPGVQWGHGAMGNARWSGVRLGDVLRRVGFRNGALEVAFDGADAPLIAKTPDFIKSLPLWKALDEDTIIAFEMNGEPLPHWNGYPARLVVPGWTATYWVKHLVSIRVGLKPYEGFWMSTAYRVPKGAFLATREFSSQTGEANTPVTELVVNSLLTNVKDHDEFPLHRQIEVKGIAWDGGHGIQKVEVSKDDGRSWTPADLGGDHGRYSWRPWTFRFTPLEKGNHVLLAKATNRNGDTQGSKLILNPAGYHHNLVQRVRFNVV